MLGVVLVAAGPVLGVPLRATGGKPLGFGATATGGAGGRVLLVTRLDDDVKKPAKGTLRWALRQKGPRTVKFSVGGTITLKDRIEVKESFLTVDGTDAPDGGITIRGGSLEFEGVEEIVLRHLRIRLGDENVLRRNKAEKRHRPKAPTAWTASPSRTPTRCSSITARSRGAVTSSSASPAVAT
ncbi:hypothetical protein [Verrucomicrobium spinosum]|uniref:hypothetical protein n=1 Tax=Verrucomicrobium spinosum TaxID=2736 RepID=UPI000AE2490E|nr:hypothetical protein [Verrucomicrobium spinosum]